MRKYNQVLNTFDVFTSMDVADTSIVSLERIDGKQDVLSSILFFYSLKGANKHDQDEFNLLKMNMKSISKSYKQVVLNDPCLAGYLNMINVGLILPNMTQQILDLMLDSKSYNIYLKKTEGLELFQTRKDIDIPVLILDLTAMDDLELTSLNQTIQDIIECLHYNRLTRLILNIPLQAIANKILLKFENQFDVQILFIANFSTAAKSKTISDLGFKYIPSHDSSNILTPTKRLDEYVGFCNQYFYQDNNISYCYPIRYLRKKTPYNLVYYDDTEIYSFLTKTINIFNIIDIIK